MTAPRPEIVDAAPCPACGTQVAARLLACPACRTLVHRNALERLSTAARDAESRGDAHAALEAWRDALPLLPADSRQREAVAARIAALVDGPPKAKDAKGEPGTRRYGLWGAVAAAALFLVGKGKLLLLGLTKLPTLLSMAASFGVYWTLFGWRWALGIIAGIYVHELGHVAALARYGVRSTAMMFVPGLGAFVTWKQRLGDPGQEARVSLAGPLYGLGAGLAALALGRLTGHEWLAAVGAVTGGFNLLNLVPVPPLDGVHAFRVLTRAQRLTIAIALVAESALLPGKFALLVLLTGLVLAAFAFFTDPAPEPDHGAFALFLGTALSLGWLATVPVAVG